MFIECNGGEAGSRPEVLEGDSLSSSSSSGESSNRDVEKIIREVHRGGKSPFGDGEVDSIFR